MNQLITLGPGCGDRVGSRELSAGWAQRSERPPSTRSRVRRWGGGDRHIQTWLWLEGVAAGMELTATEPRNQKVT